MKERVFQAQTENLDRVLDYVTEALDAVCCPAKTNRQIAIAVEEIFVNIARYAYGGRAGDVTVRMDAGDETVIEFIDSGKPYNPLTRKDPDITLSADERAIGGLGVYMVKNIMDTVEYRYDAGRNILRTVKAIR